MPKKTRAERIAALKKEWRKSDARFEKKLLKLQSPCKHENVKTVREVVGFNGYSNDYSSSCKCLDCDMYWYHDGYCSDGSHSKVRS